jgi:AraC-like DNA-binding protein
MNPQYFCRFFKTHFHTTPISYINQYRVTQAADLLTGSSLSILEIALHTGFESPSYFASIFRRTFGMSPEEYRKAMP